MKRVIVSAVALLGATLIQPLAFAAGKPSEGHDHMKMEMHEDRIEATGVINSIDPESRKLNISHEPITALGWPSMTMDFGISDKVDLATLKTGENVQLMLAKGKDGGYLIDEVIVPDQHSHQH